MIVRCAWCGNTISEKEPLSDRSVTDGICDGCMATEFPSIYHIVKGLRVTERDRYPRPTNNPRVAWTCQYCGAIHMIEYATDSLYLRCDGCQSEHRVVGMHINGSPMLRLIAVTGGVPMKQ